MQLPWFTHFWSRRNAGRHTAPLPSPAPAPAPPRAVGVASADEGATVEIMVRYQPCRPDFKARNRNPSVDTRRWPRTQAVGRR